MKNPYIVTERGGWWHAYESRWAWWRGKEPILRARSWESMQKAVEGMKASKGKLLLQESRG